MRDWRRSLFQIIKVVSRLLFFRYNDDGRPPLFLTGTRRSGTTWASEVLSQVDRFVVSDQPFSYYHLSPKRMRLYEAFYCKGVPRYCSSEFAELVCNEVEFWRRTGRVPNANWRPMSGPNTRVASRLLIKELDFKNFAELRRYGLEFFQVHVIRDPSEVVASIMRNGWGDQLSGWLVQEDAISLLSRSAQQVIERHSSGDVEKRHWLTWAIENELALRSASGHAVLIRYQHLRDSLKGAIDAGALAVSDVCLNTVDFDRPSRTAALGGGRKKNHSEERKDWQVEILNAFDRVRTTL